MMRKEFWGYIREREHIRLRKTAGAPPPWTKDAILASYKFTNVHRLHDRTTQAFLRDYRNHRDSPADIALYNCAVRRFFGTAEFADTAGWLSRHSLPALRVAVRRCVKPYTGAYMVRGGAAGVPKVDTIAAYLAAMWTRRADIVSALRAQTSWRAGYDVMTTCYGFGGNGFMAKEVLSDFLLWLDGRWPVADEETWTPVGPGARRGLNRVAGRALTATMTEDGGNAEIAALREYVRPLYREAFPADRLPLTAHDIQFCLCEFDKYQRTLRGEGRPRSKYAGGAR